MLIVCCDGLKGLPDAIEATWPQALVQTCVIHLLRASMRLCSWKDRKAIVAGLRRVYTAVNAEAAAEALDELEEQWGNRYPGVIRIWRQAWEEFTPFLKVPAGASQGRVHHACLNGGCGSAGGDDSCTPCPTCFGVVALLVSVSPPVARSVLSLDRSVTCICPPWGGMLFRRMDALRRAFCRSRKYPQSIGG